MNISQVLNRKRNRLTTARATDSIEFALNLLTGDRIGALVICDTYGKLVGILSERDLIRGLRDQGAAILKLTIADLMTTHVKTCTLTDTVKDVMSLMTLHRIRHVPVLEDGRLCGIVSIGDIVKSRLDEKEHEVHVLQDISRLKVA